jgi:two-component system alkaline phosphatase synthesis response regulator PhoP
MSEKILVVEDEIVLQETLSYNLKAAGFEVKTADNGAEGLHIARNWHPDLILLDVMLPVMDGFEVCKALRLETDIPILMLTARSEEIDRVIGFEIGADDYIVKPFSTRELIARIRTRLKAYQRIQATENKKTDSGETGQVTFGNLVIDRDRYEIRINNEVVSLKPKEMELLCFMVDNRGRALSREVIMNQVWGWEYTGGSRTVDVHIRWLRSKIEEDPSHPTRLVTVPGMGYRFEG